MIAICSVKEIGHKCHIFAWFRLYKIFRIGKSIGTKSRALVASSWEKGRVTANGHRASLWDDRNALKLECCNGGTTLWIYWKPGFSENSIKSLKKELMPIFHKLFPPSPHQKQNRREHFPTHSMRQILPWYHNQTMPLQKRKLHTNIHCEYKARILHKIIKKLIPATYKRDYKS